MSIFSQKKKKGRLTKIKTFILYINHLYQQIINLHLTICYMYLYMYMKL